MCDSILNKELQRQLMVAKFSLDKNKLYRFLNSVIILGSEDEKDSYLSNNF